MTYPKKSDLVRILPTCLEKQLEEGFRYETTLMQKAISHNIKVEHVFLLQRGDAIEQAYNVINFIISKQFNVGLCLVYGKT